MFDPEYNPYDVLEKLAHQQRDQAHQMEQLAKAVMQHKDTIEQLIEANNKHVDLIKNLLIDVKELQDRQLLLEIARQYETTKSD